jgi:hypothetical protein
MRRAGPAALALAGVLAASAGCGGDAPAAAPAAAAAPTTQVDPARGLTQQQAQRALLAVGDLPLGFQPQDDGEATALGCAGIDGVYLARGAAARAAASFGHSIGPAFVNETITTRPGGAQAALAGFARAARECASFSGGGVTYKVVALRLPRYGDGSAAVRVTSGLTEGRPVDLVAVRIGDTIVAVAAAGAGQQDVELTRTVVDRALVKIARSR